MCAVSLAAIFFASLHPGYKLSSLLRCFSHELLDDGLEHLIKLGRLFLRHEVSNTRNQDDAVMQSHGLSLGIGIDIAQPAPYALKRGSDSRSYHVNSCLMALGAFPRSDDTAFLTIRSTSADRSWV